MLCLRVCTYRLYAVTRVHMYVHIACMCIMLVYMLYMHIRNVCVHERMNLILGVYVMLGTYVVLLITLMFCV